jgi:hypothetical protein
MVDRLRRALDDLEAPICPNCHIEMTWSRSWLNAPDTISHLFQCDNCGRLDTTTSTIQPIIVPPDKLSAPRYKRVA